MFKLFLLDDGVGVRSRILLYAFKMGYVCMSSNSKILEIDVFGGLCGFCEV